jgi:hypothetical protein
VERLGVRVMNVRNNDLGKIKPFQIKRLLAIKFKNC